MEEHLLRALLFVPDVVLTCHLLSSRRRRTPVSRQVLTCLRELSTFVETQGSLSLQLSSLFNDVNITTWSKCLRQVELNIACDENCENKG